jgi:sugar lactone lactonase YvrE
MKMNIRTKRLFFLLLICAAAGWFGACENPWMKEATSSLYDKKNENKDGGPAPQYAWVVTTIAGGNLYVTEAGDHRIRKIANDGLWTVTTIAGDGTADWLDDIGTAAQFNGPIGMTMDAGGNLYVADIWNHRIRKLSRQRIK